MSDQLKQLRIQAGVVKRNAKELVYYRKEQGQIRSKMDKMKTDGEEEYYIGKQNELLTETTLTSEDTIRRLTEATEKLELLMGTCDQDPTVIASKEFQAAKESLELAKNADCDEKKWLPVYKWRKWQK